MLSCKNEVALKFPSCFKAPSMAPYYFPVYFYRSYCNVTFSDSYWPSILNANSFANLVDLLFTGIGLQINYADVEQIYQIETCGSAF